MFTVMRIIFMIAQAALPAAEQNPTITLPNWKNSNRSMATSLRAGLNTSIENQTLDTGYKHGDFDA